MKLYTSAFILGFFLVTNIACAQKYERVYADANQEVRQQIDHNKISGSPMLSGVRAHYTVGISGLNAAQVAAFQAEITADPRAISVNISPDGSSLVLDSRADLAREEISEMLSHYNAVIIACAASYSLSEE